jgi:hypothetical protein
MMEIGKFWIRSTITTQAIGTIWNRIFGFPEIHLILELHTISGQSLKRIICLKKIVFFCTQMKIKSSKINE